MPSAAKIRLQVESALAARIPSALTPQPRFHRPHAPTGNSAVDALLDGGLPIGAVTELVGAECTGRTSLAFSLVARMTEANKVCAWVDASNALDPQSASAAGINLRRLLWIRCGIERESANTARPAFHLPPKYLLAAVPKKGLHGGGFGPHPRSEIRGLPEAVTTLFRAEPRETHSATVSGRTYKATDAATATTSFPARRGRRAAHYDALERALRSTDLILQTGGFSTIVLDLASIAPEHVSRIELSTWHRYRVAAEKAQTCFLLLTQHPCAKSGSELQLHLSPASSIEQDSTVFCGLESHLSVERQRFRADKNPVIPIRKPVRSERNASWHNRSFWAGAR